MPSTLPHDPDNPAEVSAVQTPDGEPDAELLNPDDVDFDDESSEDVLPE